MDGFQLVHSVQFDTNVYRRRYHIARNENHRNMWPPKHLPVNIAHMVERQEFGIVSI